MLAQIGAFQAPYRASVAGEAPLDGQDGRDIVAGYNATKSGLFPIGFGTTSSGGSATTSLMHVDVNFVTQPDYNADYSGGITDVMMCAADVGQDSCQGDSGGGLVR